MVCPFRFVCERRPLRLLNVSIVPPFNGIRKRGGVCGLLKRCDEKQLNTNA